MNLSSRLDILSRRSNRATLAWLRHHARVIAQRLGVVFSVSTPHGRLAGSGDYLKYMSDVRLGTFEPYSLRLFREAAEIGSPVVVDVGAYLGVYSLVAMAAQPRGLIAIEPHPSNFRWLNKNIRSSPYFHADRTIITNAAAGSKEGDVVLSHDGGGHSTSTVIPSSMGRSAAHSVPLVRLDDLLDACPSRLTVSHLLLKIDVEGYEMEVLKGARSAISQCANVAILIEFNPAALEHHGQTPQRLLNELRTMGFEVRAIDETQARLTVAPTKTLAKSDYCNCLAAKGEYSSMLDGTSQVTQ